MSGYPYGSVGGFVVPPVMSGLDDNYVRSRDGFHRYNDIVCPEALGHSRGSGQGFAHVPRTNGWTDLDGSLDTSDDEIEDWGPPQTAFGGDTEAFWAARTPAFWAAVERGSRHYTEGGHVFGAPHLSTHRSTYGSSHRSGATSTRHGSSHRSGPGGSHHGSGHAFQSNFESHRPSEHGSTHGSRYGLGSSHHGSQHDSNFGGHSSHHGHHSSHRNSHLSSHHGGGGSSHGTRYGLASSHHGNHSSHHGGGGSRRGTSRPSALRTELSW